MDKKGLYDELERGMMESIDALFLRNDMLLKFMGYDINDTDEMSRLKWTMCTRLAYYYHGEFNKKGNEE